MARAGRRRALLGLGVLLAGLATGCATPTPPTDAASQGPISGRLALSVTPQASAFGDRPPARAASSLFELSGSPALGALVLTTPLGNTVARASWSPGEARIVSSEGERRFASLDDLGRELLGEPVPIAALFDWLRGRPTELAPSRWIDGLRSFEQLGWRVDLGQFTEGRLRLDRHGTVRVELRVVLDAPAPAP